MLDLVHKQKGTICSYCLKLEGDEENDYYVYVGWTKDLEKRMLEHTGVREGGAAFCKLHTPTENTVSENTRNGTRGDSLRSC